MRQYQNALHMLSRIQQRDAEWYYLSAVAHAGVGNRVMALNHAQEAVRLDPSNAEYQRLLNRIQQGGQEYRQAGQQQGFNMQGMGGSLLMCALAQMACCFCCR
jgi:molecular chaperone DnaJ